MIRRLNIEWPDPAPFADRGGRPIRWLVVSDERDPALEYEVNRVGLGVLDAIVGCGDLEPDYLGFLGDAFGVPVDYVRGNHDQGGRWARTVDNEAPLELASGRWHEIDGIPVVALEWPGIRHRDRLRHDRTAWVDVAACQPHERQPVAPWPPRTGGRHQPRAAARDRRPRRRPVPRRVRRLSLAARPHPPAALAARARPPGERGRLEAAVRRYDRRERDRRGPAGAASAGVRPGRIGRAPRGRRLDREWPGPRRRLERRPGDGRPVRGGEREAPGLQQRVDPPGGRPHLGPAQERGERRAQLAVEPVADPFQRRDLIRRQLIPAPAPQDRPQLRDGREA